MAEDDADGERALIRAVDEQLTATYGVVVDDVVLRTWGNEQVELTYLLLSAAISASGGEVDEAGLWSAARSIAFPDVAQDRGATERPSARSRLRRHA